MNPVTRAPRRTVLFAVLGVAVLAVSTAAPMARLAAEAGVPAVTIAFWRMCFSTLATAPMLVGRRARPAIARRDLALAALGGLLLAVHFGTWIESLSHTSIAASTVLVSTAPLFGAAWAAMFLGERVRGRQGLGIGIAMLGAVGILFDRGAGETGAWGNILALIGGATAGGYWVVGRALRPRLPLGVYVTWVYAVAAAALFGVAWTRGDRLVGWSGEVWLLFVLLALGPGLLGHTLLNWSLRWLPAPLAGVLTLGEPVGAAILAALLPAIAELPGSWTLLGGTVTLVGVGVALSGRRSG